VLEFIFAQTDTYRDRTDTCTDTTKSCFPTLLAHKGNNYKLHNATSSWNRFWIQQ